jgi:hypothetical protein
MKVLQEMIFEHFLPPFDQGIAMVDHWIAETSVVPAECCSQLSSKVKAVDLERRNPALLDHPQLLGIQK